MAGNDQFFAKKTWHWCTANDHKALVKQFFEAQNGKCGICGKPGVLVPPNKQPQFSKRNVSGPDDWGRVVGLVLDHCHKTHRARGLLCPPCNTGLGFFKDNRSYLLRAINYLNGTLDKSKRSMATTEQLPANSAGMDGIVSGGEGTSVEDGGRVREGDVDEHPGRDTYRL